MKTKTSKSLVLGAALLLPLVALRASAEDAPAASAPAVSAEDPGAPVVADAAVPIADAGEDADADAGPPPPPRFDEMPFAEEKSPMPKDTEWKDAKDVSFSTSTWHTSCKRQRIREWIRLQCDFTAAKVTLLGGEANGVRIKLAPLHDEWEQFPSSGEIIFPVRRGDRRVFEWQGVEFGYKGANTATSQFVLSECWAPGDEKPTIFMR